MSLRGVIIQTTDEIARQTKYDLYGEIKIDLAIQELRTYAIF